MDKKIGLFWLREDFRLSKNNGLIEATINHEEVVVFYLYKENNYQNRPLIVMGDFNANPHDLPIELLSEELDDSFKILPTENPIGTFNGFNLDSKLLDRIDYIFTKNIKITNYKHLDKKLSSGLWPSDHLPILITY